MRLLMRPSIVGCLLVVALFATSALAQNRNANAVFRLDVTSGDDNQLATTFSADGVVPDVPREFNVVVVLNDAVNLMGANCDLDFDSDALEVVSIRESFGDVNFDGRVNIFDVREIGARLGAITGSTNPEYSRYFDLNSDGKIDETDIQIVNADPEFNKPGAFLTSNDPGVSPPRESAEIFEDPSISNQNGLIDDIVFVLLARPEITDRDAFSFTGDARVAEITFRAKDTFSGNTTLSFIPESLIAIDSGTTITTTAIEGSSVPQSAPLTVRIPAP